MEQIFQQLRLGYQQGEQLYAALLGKRPEGTDIIISPRAIGDTVCVCAFTKAYKEQHNCRSALMVLPETQKELVSFFPSVDMALPMNKTNLTALRIYIGINELWKQPHIIYAHHPFAVEVHKTGIRFEEKIPIRSMLTLNQRFLDLTPDTMPERMTMPANSLPEEVLNRYQNAVMLMPCVHSMDPLPEAFWEKLAKRLQERGLRVFSNYNGVEGEYVVKGTEALGSTFRELVDFSRCFRAFVSTRSGICDLLAGTDAPLVCLLPTYQKGSGISMHPVQKEFADLSPLGRTENIWSFQYQEELEEELLNKILHCIA